MHSYLFRVGCRKPPFPHSQSFYFWGEEIVSRPPPKSQQEYRPCRSRRTDRPLRLPVLLRAGATCLPPPEPPPFFSRRAGRPLPRRRLRRPSSRDGSGTASPSTPPR